MTDISRSAAIPPAAPQAGSSPPRVGCGGLQMSRAAGKDAQGAARSFEAMVLGQMLQPMFDTVGTDDTFGGGAAEGILKPMLVTEYAKLMEQRGGIGLAPAVQAAMERSR